MKKTILLLLVCICTAASLSAQSNSATSQRTLRFGITGGANYLQLENYGGGAYAYFDYATSWQVGVTAQYKW